MKSKRYRIIITMWLVVCMQRPLLADDLYRTIPLQSQITHVQPMTGIVLWASSSNSNTDSVQLEFLPLGYNDVVKQQGTYDWSTVEQNLKSIAGRNHQAILRFHDTEPGKVTSVPDYFKALPNYKEMYKKVEDKNTSFPDWSNTEYQKFILDFYEKLAEKYDCDPRVAFLQVGFGLWSEYHIYKGPAEIIGKTFPNLEFQVKFFQQMTKVFHQTPWMISQDAHDSQRAPFVSTPELLKIKFGLFDDSFYRAWKPSYNLEGWKFFGLTRFEKSPVGGEILFDNNKILIDNKKIANYVFDNWAPESRHFGITFLIGDEWPRFTKMDKIREHGLACGYKFQVTSFKANSNEALLKVKNIGVAPIYYDAFMTINGVRSHESLMGLLPENEREFRIPLGGETPKIKLTIECDRLLSGQNIEFNADLK